MLASVFSLHVRLSFGAGGTWRAWVGTAPTALGTGILPVYAMAACHIRTRSRRTGTGSSPRTPESPPAPGTVLDPSFPSVATALLGPLGWDGTITLREKSMPSLQAHSRLP